MCLRWRGFIFIRWTRKRKKKSSIARVSAAGLRGPPQACMEQDSAEGRDLIAGVTMEVTSARVRWTCFPPQLFLLLGPGCVCAIADHPGPVQSRQGKQIKRTGGASAPCAARGHCPVHARHPGKPWQDGWVVVGRWCQLSMHADGTGTHSAYEYILCTANRPTYMVLVHPRHITTESVCRHASPPLPPPGTSISTQQQQQDPDGSVNSRTADAGILPYSVLCT